MKTATTHLDFLPVNDEAIIESYAKKVAMKIKTKLPDFINNESLPEDDENDEEDE